MSHVKKVVDLFGGQSSLAAAVGTRQSTVSYWVSRNRIPEKWHVPLVKAAVDKGLSLSSRDLYPSDGSVAPEKPVMPIARYPGTLAVGDGELQCFVLDDGRRVITRTGAANYLTDGKGGGNLESYLKVESLAPFLPRDIGDQFFDIQIPQVVNKTIKAMSASSFIDICKAYSRARDTGALKTESQTATATRASILLGVFAKLGIEAAIDEVTGYQYERTEDALQTKLKLFLEEEMRPWEPTFPDELWVQFGRLTNWKGGINQRPKYWGKLVMELVYGYMDKDVCDWLKTNAPKPRKGQNYHQWLNAQFGLKKLTEHIWMLVGMASACNDMPELRQRMAEKFGREGVQFTLYLPPASPGNDK